MRTSKILYSNWSFELTKLFTMSVYKIFSLMKWWTISMCSVLYQNIGIDTICSATWLSQMCHLWNLPNSKLSVKISECEGCVETPYRGMGLGGGEGVAAWTNWLLVGNCGDRRCLRYIAAARWREYYWRHVKKRSTFEKDVEIGNKRRNRFLFLKKISKGVAHWVLTN